MMKRARMMIAASMVIFGTLAPFVRSIQVSSGELALYRAVLASVMIAVYLAATGQKIPLAGMGRDLPLLLLSGIAMGVNWILLFEAYRYTTVSVATLSYYFAPVIVTAVCPFLFRERLTRRQIACFVLSTLGLVLITWTGGASGTGRDMTGILYALGAAVLYASVVLVNKFIKQVDGIHRTLLQFIAAVVTLIPYVAATSGVTLGGMDARGWACLLIVGFVHTGFAYCLYFTALKGVPGQSAAILSYIDPLVAVLISVLLLGETMTALQAVGGAMILGFTLLNEIAPGIKAKEN